MPNYSPYKSREDYEDAMASGRGEALGLSPAPLSNEQFVSTFSAPHLLRDWSGAGPVEYCPSPSEIRRSGGWQVVWGEG